MASRTAAATQPRRTAKPESSRSAALGGIRRPGERPMRGIALGSMLALQRTAGNQAVLRLFGGSGPGRTSPAGPTLSTIQRAGHTDAWCFSKDKRYVIKITSKDEADVYADADYLKIGNVIPGRVAELASYADIAQYEPVRTLRQPGDNEKIIVIENLAQKRQSTDSSPMILDAKIGYYTASSQQAEKEGVTLPGFKAARHFIIDTVMYSSRQKGYRFEEGQDVIDMMTTYSHSGLYSDMTPEVHPLALAGMLKKICADLNAIKEAMLGADITFVGSSVLLIITPSQPQDCQAKMIDFAHPIYKDDVEFDYFLKYRLSYTFGIASLVKDLQAIEADLRGVRYRGERDQAVSATDLHDVL
jgi:Inositol polyphosphate kinase